MESRWDGLPVRRESLDPRHPQESLSHGEDKLPGSKRPEQEDDFTEDLFPSGVDPEKDL